MTFKKIQRKKKFNIYLLSFLLLTIVFSVALTLTRLNKNVSISQEKQSPSPEIPSYKDIDTQLDTHDWKIRTFILKNGDPLKVIGELTILVPQNLKYSQKKLYDQQTETLVLDTGTSQLYIGDYAIFSTSGSLYCISCKKVATMNVTVLNTYYTLDIFEDITNDQHRFITKLNSLNFLPCPNCQFDASITTTSLEDVKVFGKVLETLQFYPSPEENFACKKANESICINPLICPNNKEKCCKGLYAILETMSSVTCQIPSDKNIKLNRVSNLEQ